MSPQKKASLFLFLTFALSLLSYIPILRAGTGNVQGGLFVLTMMWSPGLAAILTQLIATRSLRGLGWELLTSCQLYMHCLYMLLPGSPVWEVS